MPAYLFASYDITDPDAYLAYGLAADPLLAKHGGEMLVADVEAKTIEGHGGAAGVVLKFATEAAALDFYNDPDYSALKHVRHGATTNGTVTLACDR